MDKLMENKNTVMGVIAVIVVLAAIGWYGGWFGGQAPKEVMAPAPATTTEQPATPDPGATTTEPSTTTTQ